MGGVKCWYIRRYKRILVPYFIIADIGNILAVMGGRTIAEAVLNISTISYWLEHKGAWYIAMLIPLYAITPVHDAICKKIKKSSILHAGYCYYNSGHFEFAL